MKLGREVLRCHPGHRQKTCLFDGMYWDLVLEFFIFRMWVRARLALTTSIITLTLGDYWVIGHILRRSIHES